MNSTLSRTAAIGILLSAWASLGFSSCHHPTPPPPDGGCAPSELDAAPAVTLQQSPGALQGFVDLHAHPMSNLGFAGKLIYGGNDSVGALLPADPNCNEGVRSTCLSQALGHCGSVHG